MILIIVLRRVIDRYKKNINHLLYFRLLIEKIEIMLVQAKSSCECLKTVKANMIKQNEILFFMSYIPFVLFNHTYNDPGLCFIILI